MRVPSASFPSVPRARARPRVDVGVDDAIARVARVARRRVAVDRSIGRIESNREEVSIHPVLSDS